MALKVMWQCDWMTTAMKLPKGNCLLPSRPVCSSPWDAIVSTIGFLGRRSLVQWKGAEVSKRILSAKNVPYIVGTAANSFLDTPRCRGLQSVVLYAPAGTGWSNRSSSPAAWWEKTYLIPERVQRLIGRLKRWIPAALLQPNAELRLCCTASPGYGATGTAALLNVPRSLLKFLQALKTKATLSGICPKMVKN